MKLNYVLRAACAAALGATIASPSGLAATLFSDNFTSAAVSMANYAVVTSDPTSSYQTYAYDYSVIGIPPAPNTTDGSTRGVKLDANNGAPNAAEGITLHTNLSFTGDYSVKFDAWMNVNGPFPGGGTGSTTYLSAGVGGNGITNNRITSNGDSAAVSGVGGWTAVNGECGNGKDYRFYKGTVTQLPATGQYAATDTDPSPTAENVRNGELNPYYAGLGGVDVESLPVQGGVGMQKGESPGDLTYAGAFGMKWQQVELRVDADGGTGGAAAMTWIISGKVIGTLDAGASGAFSTTGRVTFGFADPTSGGADAPQYNFGLIDNLRVDDFTVVPEPSSLALFGLSALGMFTARRRRA